jgi:hypothetical protein
MSIDLGDAKAKITPLFALPIVEGELPENLQDELEAFYTPLIPTKSSYNLPQGSDYFDKNKNYDLHPVLDEYTNVLSKKLIEELMPQGPHSTSMWRTYWIQDYKQGEYHAPHMHGGAIVSGVYVLRSNDKGAPLTLLNPDNSRAYATDASHEWQLPSTRGRIYLWPSWVDHYVSPSFEEDVERTTVVFNIGFNS